MTGDRPDLRGEQSNIDRNRPWAVFLDFDGTLVEIADRPNMVEVDPALPRLLADLRSGLAGAVALISGRSIATLDRLLAPLRLDTAGLHGLEWRCAGHSHTVPSWMGDRLREAVDVLRIETADWPGVLVEDKGATVAVHFRLALAHAPQVRGLVERTLRRLGPQFRLQTGKAVYEIVPIQASKGRAVERFLSMPPYAGRRAVFAGDDATDEAAIAAVDELGGIAIRIGREGRSLAKVRISNPTELRRVLGEWTRTGALPLELQTGG